MIVMRTALAPTLRAAFGERLQENVILAPYTSARIGGPADFLLEARSADELADTAQKLWQAEVPFILLGGGSNVLVSDRGVRGVVVLNRAKDVRFDEGEPPFVWVESGVVFSNLANRTASKGLAGLEWAATVPGTIGGAVYGNAGAFGGDVAHSLMAAELLLPSLAETPVQWRRERWSVDKFEYGYRTSNLKRQGEGIVVLAAEFRLNHSTTEEVRVTIDRFTAQRKSTQPPGASMGSMFKNPPGDFAGRLIEAAGLKGTRVGSAEISSVHANFFINTGRTSADDVRTLIDAARDKVAKEFGITLELEIELIGEW
jgi:UDP-N-acetylmuramate dehydrogenase